MATGDFEARDFGAGDFAAGFARMLVRVGSQGLSSLAPPVVPTERAWAEGVSRACGWLA